MRNKKLSIAVVGAGTGGLAVAATLRRVGFDVQVYEQASRFARIGAGIQMMPNSMKVLRGIGIEERLRQTAFAPYSHLNRIGDTGEVTRELPMPENPYRAVFPASLMNGKDIGHSRTKWWGRDRHIVIYYTKRDRSEIYFVTSVPEPAEWVTAESWSAKGDVKELRAAYDGFHQNVRAVR